MAAARKARWLDEPTDEDYSAALEYLTLTFTPKRAKSIVKDLERERVVHYKSRDIFRAARLPLLSEGDKHVARDLRKLRTNKPISPLLLVRVPELAEVIVADGYHRLCALYLLDEDASVACKIV